MFATFAHVDGYAHGGAGLTVAVANSTIAMMMLDSATVLSYTGFALSIFVLCIWAGMWLMHLVALIYGKYRLYKHGVKLGDDIGASMQRVWPELSGRSPSVSIIKPLVGVESNMMINLESYFLLNYPNDCYELLFCISEPHDPALMLVNTLVAKYPSVDASVFVGGMHVGVNPKINNMMPAYNAAKYPLILVSDAGIFMRPNTLNNMVLAMDAKAGVVHQMPYTVDRCELGFPACLEKTFFGTAHARIYLAADVLGVNCCTGMSCLYRKYVLDECGGFAVFAKHLAEDFFFAKAFADRHWKLRLCTEPAWQNSSVCTVSYFKSRLQRWQRLRFAMLPHTILFEPFQENSFIGIIAAFSASFTFGISFWGFWIGHTLTWFIFDWLLLSVVQNGPVPYSKLEYTLAWLTREYMAPFLYIGAVVQPHIRWKNSVYRLKWGGEAVLIDIPPSTTLLSSGNDDAVNNMHATINADSMQTDATAAAATTAIDVVTVVASRNGVKLPTSVSDYEDNDDNNNADDDDNNGNNNINDKAGDEEELLQNGNAVSCGACDGAAALVIVGGDTGSSHGRRFSGVVNNSISRNGSDRTGGGNRSLAAPRTEQQQHKKAAGNRMTLRLKPSYYDNIDNDGGSSNSSSILLTKENLLTGRFDGTTTTCSGEHRSSASFMRNSLPSSRSKGGGHLKRNLHAAGMLQQHQHYSAKPQSSLTVNFPIVPGPVASDACAGGAGDAKNKLFLPVIMPLLTSNNIADVHSENDDDDDEGIARGSIKDRDNLRLIMPPSSSQHSSSKASGSTRRDVFGASFGLQAASRLPSTSSSLSSSSASSLSSTASSLKLVRPEGKKSTTKIMPTFADDSPVLKKQENYMQKL